MAYIKSRKHARGTTQDFLTAAALASLALPVAAQTAPAAAASAASAPTPQQTLPGVRVKAAAESEVKADQSASPKYTAPLRDTPQTLTVIKKELVAQQGATTLTEALRNSPGVSTFFLGENGNTNTGDTIYMRGFDTSGSIFVDGVRDLGSISRDTFNIEQFEVLKGPAGSDSGRSAPTGAINLVTKQAGLENFSAGSLTLGTESQKRATVDLNQRLGETAAFRLNGMWQDSDRPGRDVVKDGRWGLAPSFAFGLGTDTRIVFNYLHVQQDNIPDGGVHTASMYRKGSELPTDMTVDPSNYYGTKHDFDDATVDMATLKFEHDFAPELRLRNITRWGRNKQENNQTSFMNLIGANATADVSSWTLDPDPANWTVARNFNYKFVTNRILANQTTLSGETLTGPVKHSWTAGLELSEEKYDSMGVVAGPSPGPANLFHPDPDVPAWTYTFNGADSHGKTDTTALYAMDTIALTEHWLLSAGLRYDHYRTSFDSKVACVAPGGRGTVCPDGVTPGTVIPSVDLSTSDNLFNWKLGVVYKPVPSGSIYANYAISQQPPGGANFQLSSAANSANNPELEPQKAKTMELGTKWDLLEGALGLSAAIYRTDVTNEVEVDADSPTGYAQIGKKRISGIEVGVVGNITPEWQVSAGYTIMDTEVVEGANVGAVPTSDELNYTPKNAFTSWSTYKLGAFTFGGGARYTGRLQKGSDGASVTPLGASSYWVFDAVAGWQINRNFDLRLNVYNLFDKEYVAGINKSGYRYTPGAPRYVTLTGNVRF